MAIPSSETGFHCVMKPARSDGKGRDRFRASTVQ